MWDICTGRTNRLKSGIPHLSEHSRVVPCIPVRSQIFVGIEIEKLDQFCGLSGTRDLDPRLGHNIHVPGPVRNDQVALSCLVNGIACSVGF
jgi:hypothetical protein